MENTLNVHFQVKIFFLIREIKVSKFRMLIRFCYDFPAPSTPFVMAYNNCFNFLLFYWKFSIKVKQTTTLYGTATPECKLIREWGFQGY